MLDTSRYHHLDSFQCNYGLNWYIIGNYAHCTRTYVPIEYGSICTQYVLWLERCVYFTNSWACEWLLCSLSMKLERKKWRRAKRIKSERRSIERKNTINGVSPKGEKDHANRSHWNHLVREPKIGRCIATREWALASFTWSPHVEECVLIQFEWYEMHMNYSSTACAMMNSCL